MDELKKPYKITLWEDRNRYAYGDNNEITNQWLEEVCIATIGSNTMETPIRAFNPILIEDLNGSKTFTFSMLYRYWDDEDEEFKINPFINLLVNERKIKLLYGTETRQLGDVNQDGVVDEKDKTLVNNYIARRGDLTKEQETLADITQDGNINATDVLQIGRTAIGRRPPQYIEFPQWHDFVIKQVQENSETNSFTYTCKDLFVNELGKTGYDIELDTELQNNMGTVTQLAETILNGSTWTVNATGSDLLRQYNKEMLYSVQLSSNKSATAMLSGDSISLETGTIIYIPYSCVANQENPCQAIYVQSGEPKIDDQGFISNGINCTFVPGDGFYTGCAASTYFGEKLIQKQKTVYFPQIEETCALYKKDNVEYYAYTETEYASVPEIQSMLSNNSEFITTNGWSICYESGQAISSISMATYPLTTVEPTAPIYSALKFTKENGAQVGKVKNSGFYDNRAQFSPSGTISGEPYIFAIKTSSNNLISGAQVIARNKDDQLEDQLLFDFNAQSEIISAGDDAGIQQLLDGGYKVFGKTCGTSINYQELVSQYSNIEFILSFTDTVYLLDSLAFKRRYDANNNTIIPDIAEVSYQEGSANNSLVKTYYNFFPADTDFTNIFSKQDLTITERTEDISLYEVQYEENFEKVTSISGSKSNRFNLIQSLCEAFECWAKFSIIHNSKGQTTYEYVQLTNRSEVVSGGRYYTRKQGSISTIDDSDFEIVNTPVADDFANYFKKVYHKYVTFKEYIGKNNLVGFRYGINLKSIQRNIVSDQIATKVIVQPNTNEFAPNGSCTIQQANLNPTGENALYNFQYFINHGLLDGDALNDDLYGTNGGLGFFTRMFALNKQIAAPLEELTQIGLTLNTLESRNTVYSTLLIEAQNNKTAIEQELLAAGYGHGETGGGEYVDKLRKQLKSYDSMIAHYTEIQADTATMLREYQGMYTAKLALLQSIRDEKDQINSEFQNKYSQFIQEGTWNSNDYWDPELYFQAANMVSFTSAFPQVSYTINVLEISAVEGYEPYTFQIGDKTYIEDTKFFGYDDKHRPYKEEIVVSQVKINLDDPSQNTITVRNYKTQFQDLFQRIAASSQSLQYHEGEYMRAAGAITGTGEIDSTILQNSLMNNSLIIANAKNQLVSWDDTGITITSSKNANEIVRLTSGGIVLTADGGQSWTTGITGSGINANVITAGRIDTSRIRIFNEGQQTFEWNGKGIHAFAFENDKVNYGKFVRFDQYGLYGYAGGNPDWDPNVQEQSETIGISKVIRDSIFSLTWEGLSINIGTQANNVINVNNKFKVDGNGNLTCNNASITNGSFSGSIYAGGTITSGTSIYSPNIYANKFTVRPADGSSAPGTVASTGFSIQEYFSQITTPGVYEYFNIQGIDAYDVPWTKIWAPCGGALSINFTYGIFLDGGSTQGIKIDSKIDFSGATVMNLFTSDIKVSSTKTLDEELADIWAAIGS